MNTSSRPGTLIYGGFFLLLVFCIFTRLTTYEEAFERDLMVYSVVGEGLNDGRPLYTEMWDHKPPAIHWTYALIMKAAGFGPLSIYLLGLGAAISSMYGIYRAGCLLKSPGCGLLAAVIWTFFSGDLYLQANQPNVEVFMNVCLVFGFVMILRYDKRGNWLFSVVAGIFFFFATLYKTVAIVTVLCLCTATVLSSLFNKDRSLLDSDALKKWFRFILGLACTACAGWVSVFLYFQLSGNFTDFYDAVFVFNRTYAGNILSNIVKGFSPNTHEVYVFPFIGMFLILGYQIAGNAWKKTLGQDEKNIHSLLLLAYLIGAWLAMALPGKYFPHYYQLLLPPISLCISWVFMTAGKQKVVISLLVLGLTLSSYIRLSQFSLPLEQIPLYKYGNGHGPEALESKRVGLWLKQHDYHNVYMWGAEPGIYFWAGIHPFVGISYLKPMVIPWKNRSKFIRRVLTQLDEARPDVIIANHTAMSVLRNHPVTIWILDNYSNEAALPGLSSLGCYFPKAGEIRNID